MDHLLEGLQGLPPTRWVGESGGDELRVLPLQLLQPAQLVVIVVVRHGPGVLDIVFIVSLFQLPAQGLELLRNGPWGTSSSSVNLEMGPQPPPGRSIWR